MRVLGREVSNHHSQPFAAPGLRNNARHANHREPALNPPPSWQRDGADWPLREASQWLDVAGQRWHVQRLGQGPPMLLLHGTGASTHSWRALAPLLAPHFELLLPDLPGHGFSQALPASQRSLPGMAKALGALLDHLGARPQLVLGHSAGAALMLRLALDARWTRPKLLGLNAALLPFAGLAGWLYPPMAWLLARNPLVPHLAAWRARDERAVRRLTAATGSRLDAQGVALYARLLRRPDHVAGVLAMMANWNLQDLARDLPQLRCPLTLVAADGDLTVPPAQADQAAARVPGAHVLHWPGLGHLAHEEAPERVAALLRDGLAQ